MHLLVTLIVVIILLNVIGSAVPVYRTSNYYGWGWGGSGGIVAILLILWLLGFLR